MLLVSIQFVYPQYLTVITDNDMLLVPYGLTSPSGGSILKTPDDVLKILDYLLNHTKGAHSLQKNSSFAGLPLLPLESDEIGVIGKSKVYIHSSPYLLPYGKQLFLSNDGFECILLISFLFIYYLIVILDLRDQPKVLEALGLKYLTSSDLGQLWDNAFPPSWRGKSSVSWSPSDPPHTTKWLWHLWDFIEKDRNYKAFSEWFIIPARGKLVTMSMAKSVVVSFGPQDLVADVLQKMGCDIFDPEAVPSFPVHLLSNTSALGVCQALKTRSDLQDFVFTSEEATVSSILKFAF